MTYTEDEIEAAARMITNLTTPETKWTPRELAIAALAAVPRVPAGHWIAPDEPDEEMKKALIRAFGYEPEQRIETCVEMIGATYLSNALEAYRAMRDIVKGRKP